VWALQAAVAALIVTHPDHKAYLAAFELTTQGSLAMVENMSATSDAMIDGFQEMAGNIRRTPSAKA